MAIKNQYLDERFTLVPNIHPALPFFHTCEALHLQSILDSGELQPQYCDVYKENLLYLFYGKPAYKTSELKHSDLNFLMPLCFIINYDAVSSIKRILAFDSGAFKRYSEHMHNAMKPEEFELTPTKDTLNKMVDFFYDGNDPYFNGQVKKEVKFDSIHFQLESYYSLISSGSRDEVDDRKSTFEVQTEDPITLNNKNIEAIILPQMLAESPIVEDKLKKALGIPLISIKNYGVASQLYYVNVLEKAKDFLVTQKLLNGD